MHVEHKAADRHGGARAIIDQLLPIGVAVFGCVLPERTQQILRMARRQPPIVENCAQAQPFRLIATVAEKAGFEMIKPGDFFVARKFGMIGNVVSDANKLVKRQDGRPMLPLDQTRRDRKILVMRALA